MLWFRRDWRLSDNPGFAAALEYGGAVIPVHLGALEEAARGHARVCKIRLGRNTFKWLLAVERASGAWTGRRPILLTYVLTSYRLQL